MARKHPKMTLEIDGLDGLVKSLGQFGSKTTAKRLMRSAMNKAGTTLVKAARKNAPSDTGIMKKSLSRTVRAKDYLMTAVIGADNAVSGPNPGRNKPKHRIPSHYVHLVEYGFQHWRTGEHVPGSRFLERTRAEQGPQVSRKFAEEVGAGIQKELAKGKRKGRRKRK